MNNESSVVVAERSRMRPEQIQELLRAYESSGLTQREFVQQAGIALSTFNHWWRRHRKKEKEPGSAVPAWVPVELQARAGGYPGTYQVEYPQGARVQIPCGFNAGEVKVLLETVAACLR